MTWWLVSFYCCIIFHSMSLPQFIYSTYWEISWLFLSFCNYEWSFYKHLGVGFCVHMFLSPLAKYERVLLMDYVVRVCLVWKKQSNCLPKCLYHFIFPISMNVSLNISSSKRAEICVFFSWTFLLLYRSPVGVLVMWVKNIL